MIVLCGCQKKTDVILVYKSYRGDIRVRSSDLVNDEDKLSKVVELSDGNIYLSNDSSIEIRTFIQVSRTIEGSLNESAIEMCNTSLKFYPYARTLKISTTKRDNVSEIFHYFVSRDQSGSISYIHAEQYLYKKKRQFIVQCRFVLEEWESLFNEVEDIENWLQNNVTYKVYTIRTDTMTHMYN